MPARAIIGLVGLVFLFVASAACDRSDDSRVADRERNVDAPDRLVRQYLPFKPGWFPESVIPVEPQRSPQMMIWEVSEFDPRVAATEAQREAGREFVRRSFEAAKARNWFDRSTGMSDGFLTKGNDRLHYRHDGYILDDIQLDPERPEYLMYYEDPDREGEYALAGLMFLSNGAETRGHQFAGPLAIWHYHRYTNARCWVNRGLLPTGMVDANGRCSKGGVPRHRSPEMVHVWLIDHPRGPFSTGMTLPTPVLRAGLQKRRAELGY